jgi:hypothetical protein
VLVLDHFEALLNPHGAMARTFGPMRVCSSAINSSR